MKLKSHAEQDLNACPMSQLTMTITCIKRNGGRGGNSCRGHPPTYLSGSDWVFVKGSVVTRYKLRKDKIKKLDYKI